MGAFLSFDKFITPTVIKVVYWIGIVGVIISGIAWGFAGSQYSSFAWLGALLGIVLGLFLWRVYCELIMLWFKIHDELSGIRQNTTR
jgi:hypothetical protein